VATGVFETPGVGLAAYLLWMGHQYERIVWKAGKNGKVQGFFVFPEGEGLRTCVENFHPERATVEPRRYSQLYGETRQVLFADAGNPRKLGRP
jgi:hypothetical protein